MTFEESLPSLIGLWKPAEKFNKDYIVIPVLDVSQNCLDKERVKQAIQRTKDHINMDEDNDWTVGYCRAIQKLEEDLGL